MEFIKLFEELNEDDKDKLFCITYGYYARHIIKRYNLKEETPGVYRCLDNRDFGNVSDFINNVVPNCLARSMHANARTLKICFIPYFVDYNID